MPINYEDYQSAGICNTLLEYTHRQDLYFYKYHYEYPKLALKAIWRTEIVIIPPAQEVPDADLENKWTKEFRDRFPKQKDLDDFLKATNDESRLKKADKYSSDVLYIPDLRDASYFRDAIMRKELSADLDYAKQRDHAAHTLYNYLLGWFIYDNNNEVRRQIDNQINKRDIFIDDDPEINRIKAFGTVWTYTSLLHDIGYLLQGSLSNISSDVEVAHVSRGAATIHDYFNHYFWKDIDLDFHAARDVVKHLNLFVPDFKSVRSIAALSDNLSVFGDCEPIRLTINEEKSLLLKKNPPYAIKGKFDDKHFDKINRLDIDSFKLWELHFEVYENTESQQLISQICKIFKELVWEGLPQSNSRTINHGVASGLLSLMFSTYYYQILFGIINIKEFNTQLKDNLTKLKEEVAKLKPCEGEELANLDTALFKPIMNELRLQCLYGQQLGLIYRGIGLMGFIAKLTNQLNRDCQVNTDQYNNIESLRLELQGLVYSEFMTSFDRYNYKSVNDYILKETDGRHFPYKALNWFSLCLWGTGAAAVHDIVQNSKIWENPKFQPFKLALNERRQKEGILSLEDSPLEYLGVLVDILQEWDRYSVNKDEVFATNDRLQGTQVDIDKDSIPDKLKFIFDYTDKKDLQTGLLKALNFSLVDWKNILQINEVV